MGDNSRPPRKTRVRTNVLTPIGVGYFLVLVIFVGLLCATDQEATMPTGSSRCR